MPISYFSIVVLGTSSGELLQYPNRLAQLQCSGIRMFEECLFVSLVAVGKNCVVGGKPCKLGMVEKVLNDSTCWAETVTAVHQSGIRGVHFDDPLNVLPVIESERLWGLAEGIKRALDGVVPVSKEIQICKGEGTRARILCCLLAFDSCAVLLPRHCNCHEDRQYRADSLHPGCLRLGLHCTPEDKCALHAFPLALRSAA